MAPREALFVKLLWPLVVFAPGHTGRRRHCLLKLSISLSVGPLPNLWTWYFILKTIKSLSRFWGWR